MRLSELDNAFELHDSVIVRLESVREGELRMRVRLFEWDHEKEGGPPLPQGVGDLVFTGVESAEFNRPLDPFDYDSDGVDAEIMGADVAEEAPPGHPEKMRMILIYNDFNRQSASLSEPEIVLTIIARAVVWIPIDFQGTRKKPDKYLDKDGNPCADGSGPSRLYP